VENRVVVSEQSRITRKMERERNGGRENSGEKKGGRVETTAKRVGTCKKRHGSY